MARLLTSYILWFFGGIFGVHHFYLGRDRQAFVWWATLGGVFGLGWCRDLWRIPAYVHECNEDRNDNNNGANSNMDGNGKRKLGPVRFFGMILVGMCFGYLIQSACPAKWTRKNAVFEFVYKWVLVPCSSALGVHVVANIGRLQTNYRWPLAGVYPVFIFFEGPYLVENACLLSALITCYFGTTWRPASRVQKLSARTRLKKLLICGAIYLLLVMSSVYQNTSIQTEKGQIIPLSVALSDYFDSMEWEETYQRLCQHVKDEEWHVLIKVGSQLWQVVPSFSWIRLMVDILDDWSNVLMEDYERLKHLKQEVQWNHLSDPVTRLLYNVGSTSRHMLRKSFQRIWQPFHDLEWKDILMDILQVSDPLKETNPFKILGLKSTATQEEVTIRYRKLVLRWHPDKVKDPARKQEAQERFIKIQEAYDSVRVTLARHTNQNKQHRQRTEF